MFNSGARKEAIEKLKQAVNRHESVGEQVRQASARLHNLRHDVATRIILDVESYVNLLANSPKEFDTSIADLRIESNRFQDVVRQIEIRAAHTAPIAGGTGAAGVAAGVGVAALAPSAAMALATTFGTASTGTAISTLSGAAATSAGLAWLGGGTLAAGGLGMAGGRVLLAMTGPVGWTISGATLVGSGLYLNHRNKKHARLATEERLRVEAEVRSLEAALLEIGKLERVTERHTHGCRAMLVNLRSAPDDYLEFSDADKKRLAMLINHIQSLSEMLRMEVGL